MKSKYPKERSTVIQVGCGNFYTLIREHAKRNERVIGDDSKFTHSLTHSITIFVVVVLVLLHLIFKKRNIALPLAFLIHGLANRNS